MVVKLRGGEAWRARRAGGTEWRVQGGSDDATRIGSHAVEREGTLGSASVRGTARGLTSRHSLEEAPNGPEDEMQTKGTM